MLVKISTEDWHTIANVIRDARFELRVAAGVYMTSLRDDVNAVNSAGECSAVSTRLGDLSDMLREKMFGRFIDDSKVEAFADEQFDAGQYFEV